MLETFYLLCVFCGWLSVSIFNTGFNLPRCLRDMIRLRASVKVLCGTYWLEILRVNTMTHGLHSSRYSAAKRWNDLNESVCGLDSFNPLNANPGVTPATGGHIGFFLEIYFS